MSKFLTDLEMKGDLISFKNQVLAIIYNLYTDELYDRKDCLKALNELLAHMDECEAHYSDILSRNELPNGDGKLPDE